MQKYIGTKIILATAMPLGAYNEKRGWPMPADEDPNAPGYLVEYTDGGKPNHPDHKGYISWSPKEQFEGAYRSSPGLTFGHAIEALKRGCRVCREGWEGKGLFVFMQVPAQIPADVVPKMTSLPHSVKDEIGRRAKEGGPEGLSYSNQLALVKPDNSVNGWAPSAADTLAEDWIILPDDEPAEA